MSAHEEMTLEELAHALDRDVDELRDYITRRLSRVTLPADGELISSEQITKILRGMHRRGERLPDEFARHVRGSRSVLEGDDAGAARRRREQRARDVAWEKSVRERESRAAQQRAASEERARDFAERLDPNYVPRPWGAARTRRGDEIDDVVSHAREVMRRLDNPREIARDAHRSGLRIAPEPELFSRVMKRRREAVRVLDHGMMQRLVCDVLLLDSDGETRDAMRRADEVTLARVNDSLDPLFDVICPCAHHLDAFAPRVQHAIGPSALFEALAMPDMAELLGAYTPAEAFEQETWTRLLAMLGTSAEPLDIAWLASTLEDDDLSMRCLLPAECARAQGPMIDTLVTHVLGDASGRGARVTLRAHNENSPREFELFVGDAGAAVACITFIL